MNEAFTCIYSTTKIRPTTMVREIDCFRIQTTNDNIELTIDIPEHLRSFQTEEYEKYKIKIGYKIGNIAENEIYPIYDKEGDKRLGWGFPITSILSNDHSQASNPHFNRYRYQLFFQIIEERQIGFQVSTTVTNLGENPIDFESQFCPNTYILCFYRDLLPSGVDLDQDYKASLLKYGIVLQTSGDHREIGLKRSIFISPDKRLNLTRINNTVKLNSYVQTIFDTYINKSGNPISIFFYCYQVIEYLINYIFDLEKADKLNKLTHSKNVSELRDALEDVNKVMSEKYRIRILFQKYIDEDIEDFDIKDKIEEFLTNHSINMAASDKDNIGGYIYKMRNSIFHNFHEINNEEDLYIISNKMLLLTCDILCRLKFS